MKQNCNLALHINVCSMGKTELRMKMALRNTTSSIWGNGMLCIRRFLCIFLSGYSLYKPLPLFEIIEVFYSPMNLIFKTQMITYYMLRKSQPCWELSIFLFFYPALLLCLSIQELVLLIPSSPIKSSSSLWTSKIGSLNGLNIKRKPRKRPSFPYYF